MIRTLLQRLVLLAALASSGLLTACASSISTDLAVDTFDSAWSLINDTHFDAEFVETEWAAVRDEFRPRAATCKTQDELRALLHEMIARTEVSHFGLIEQDAAEDLMEGTDGEIDRDADVGLSLRLIDDAFVVSQVEANSPADRAGVKPGWILRKINERDLGETLVRAKERLEPEKLDLMVWSLASRLLSGEKGSEVTLVLLDGEDVEHTETLTLRESPGQVNSFGNLPPTRARLTHRWVEHDGVRVGVIHFNIWLITVNPEFDAAIDEFRDADGVIIDLRGNIGGIGGMSMGVAGHFLDERLSLGTMKSRDTNLDFVANPRLINTAGERVTPYAGPLAILQDPLSMSTSEIFTQGLQTLGRARVFGETSGGAALPSHISDLPNGDVLQHAVADFLDPEGTRLEGRGVIPDEEVPMQRSDLLDGSDAALDAAVRWIAAQK